MSNPFRPIKPGPTGRFPYGKVHESDEGEIAIAIGTDPQNNTVVIDFGKLIKWVGMPPSMAREMAKNLIEKADALEKSIT